MQVLVPLAKVYCQDQLVLYVVMHAHVFTHADDMLYNGLWVSMGLAQVVY